MTIFPNDRVWTPGRIKKESPSLLAVALVVGPVIGDDREGHEKQREKGVKNVIFMLAFSLCPFALLGCALRAGDCSSSTEGNFWDGRENNGVRCCLLTSHYQIPFQNYFLCGQAVLKKTEQY